MTIALLFKILLFFVPIIVYPSTSELFEFNKLIFVYFLTGLIVTLWLIRMVREKKLIFRRTILDIPLTAFLGSQVLATLTSIDIRTSLFGYYSRFNGGLVSLICYALLYWAWVSNLDGKKTLATIRYALYAAVLVCLYAVLQHFGVDKNLWVQDVQNRVFSTLGQPNWLAAFLVALMPLTWAFALQANSEKPRLSDGQGIAYRCIWPILNILFFITLLFTKSRSGLLGFAFADAIFWGLTFFKYKRQFVKEFFIFHFSFLVLFFIIKSPTTYNLSPTAKRQASLITTNAPALETGGTESGEIRKIVWKGALAIWRHNPLFGTGVETFAYAYYKERPLEHNLVSEWDFLYNKAHNEYLNYAATTGSFGLISYLSLIFFSIYQIIKIKNQRLKIKNTNQNSKFYTLNCDFNFCILHFALLSGYAGILVTNFFGFSVTPINILFYLFPAFAIALGFSEKPRLPDGQGIADSPKVKLNNAQKIFIVLSLFAVTYTLFAILRYWYADIAYNEAKYDYDHAKYVDSRDALGRAIAYSPSEAIYWDQLSKATAAVALTLNEAQNPKAKEIANLAVRESQKAVSLSPRNTILRRDQTTLFLKLAVFDRNLLSEAKKSVLQTIDLAPTDARLYYSLGLIYMRLGDNAKALTTLEKTIQMKWNYKEAHLAHAILLADSGEKKTAIEELNYILTKIDPKDELTQKELEDLTK